MLCTPGFVEIWEDMTAIKCLGDFIEASRSVNGDNYDYSRSVFKKMKTPVILICKKCGVEFTEMPTSHLNSAYIEKYSKRDGCKFCNSSARTSKAYFIKKSKTVHGDFYDYSKVNEFEVTGAKVEIIHKKCGKSFFQTKNGHLRGDGCPHCHCPKVRTREEFIADAVAIYGDAYDYSNIDYIDTTVNIELKCNECEAVFWDRPSNHLHSVKSNKIQVSRCPNCKDFVRNLTTEEFIEKAVAMHADKYDYSEVEYKDAKTKITIRCKACDVKFKQTSNNHLAPRENNLGGCPTCSFLNPSIESRGEKLIAEYLSNNKIEFTRQYINPECKYIKALRFDFYIPSLNLIIEYDGLQHFIPVEHWGGEENLKKTQQRDEVKNNWAKQNGLILIRFRYDCFSVDILDNAIKEISSNPINLINL